MLFDPHASQALSLFYSASYSSDWSNSQPRTDTQSEQPLGARSVSINPSRHESSQHEALSRGEASPDADRTLLQPPSSQREDATLAAKQLADMRQGQSRPPSISLRVASDCRWLEAIADRIDRGRVETFVQRLRQQHGSANPRQLTRLIMIQKAIAVGRVRTTKRLAHTTASLLKFLTVDRVSATASHIEMIYQIAAAYGLPVQAPERRAEALMLFQNLLSRQTASQAGLDMRDQPTQVKMAIALSVNTTMLYGLGYGACRFYEARLNLAETAQDEPLWAAQDLIESYLPEAIAQQVIMDQILVHMILASTNRRSWSDILPCLQKLKLVPASLAVIASHIQTPQPLYRLLNQLNSDFAVPLLIRCNKIAQLDDVITPQEVKVLEQIADKLEEDIRAIAL